MNGGLTFEVVGADGPRRYFEALTKDTIAHAYLFSGAPGVGKKTFARRLAQSLLCAAPKAGVLGYDGTCTSCVLFAAAEQTRHPDFVENDGALKIGEADGGSYDGEDLTSRQILRLFSMQSYVGGMRVLLLGDVEFASPAAANALLKFLEESPAGVVTILTTPAAGKMLPTIASRTIELQFPRLLKPELRRVLLDLGYAERQAEMGSSIGHGSVAAAIAALNTGEESLHGSAARWFFDSVAGRRPEQQWATRETLEDGLDVVRTLARDWIVARALAPQTPTLSARYAQELQQLPELGRRAAAALLAQLDEAAGLARTNVPPGAIAEYVRLALAGAAATKSA